MPSILEQATRLVHDAEIAKADAHPGEINFDANQERGEVSLSGSKGRLEGTAYVSSAWTSLKSLAVGVRGRWKLALLLALLPFSASAQTPAINGDRIGIDQAAPSLAVAQGYRYTVYVDAATVGIVSATTCSGTVSPVTCLITLPALSTGPHSLTVTAAEVIPGTPDRVLESAKSAALAIVIKAVPVVPGNPRIVP